MAMIGLAKEWVPIQTKLDQFIGWPNDIQNDCYRCKNKKARGIDWNAIKKMFNKKKGDGDGIFSFLTFLVVVSILLLLCYMFWFLYLRRT